MDKKLFFAVLSLLTVSFVLVPILPVNGWNYTDTGEEDTKFEKFGPRADNLLIKLYEDAEAGWDALAAGEIDITDWPLTQPFYDSLTMPPYNESIEVKHYGAEHGLFLLDINWNNNPYLGSPEEPGYPNPIYPNPCSCLNMRQALWHLTNHAVWGPAFIGVGFYDELNTTVPPCYGNYSESHSPVMQPYPYSQALAVARLMSDVCPADGMPDFPLHDGTGHRYWDLNGNGVYDGGDEYLELRLLIRSDHSHRMYWGNALDMELESVGLRVNNIYGPASYAMQHWFGNKEVHLYTGAWSLGVNPDYLLIWHSSSYWHYPGYCYNTGYVNDSILDQTSTGVRYANTEDEALENCRAFQDRFAEVAAAVPWWSYVGNQAVRRRYTGGSNEIPVGDAEDQWRGCYWDGLVNVQGYGVDNYWSFLNMHPRGFKRGDCEHMTIRYGFSTSEITSFNPIYAAREHEWKILGLIYDTLLMRLPYNMTELMPWIAKNYTVDTYMHPIYGECTKVKFSLKYGSQWCDGTPITAADIHFTLVELDDILRKRGYAPPSWYPNVMNILSFTIYDPYHFEVLFDAKSMFISSWLSGQIDLGYHKWPWGTPILPKHIWKPIAETGDPTGPAPDPNMIGSGPWRFKEYVPYSHVLLVANKPDTTVQTNHADSMPVTGARGYWTYSPQAVFCDEDEKCFNKVDYGQTVTITYKRGNGWYGGPITIESWWKVTFPNGTVLDGTSLFELSAKGEPGSYRLDNFTAVMKGKVEIEYYTHVKLPAELDGWHNATYLIWGTIKEDIAGSTYYDDLGLHDYPYKMQLPTPDIKVDIRDVALAAKAFGSYPGHEGWSPVADINGDYKIDIRDIAAIAKMFGWVG